MSAHPQVSAGTLVDEAVASKAPICVITGGEPAMHDLSALTEGLQAAGIRTHIETSGTHPLTGKWDWVTFSPKRFKAPLDAIYAQTDELKVIVVNRQDLAWGSEHASRLQTDARLYFQPSGTGVSRYWITRWCLCGKSRMAHPPADPQIPRSAMMLGLS